MQNRLILKMCLFVGILCTYQFTNAQSSIGIKGGVQLNNIHATQALDNLLPSLDNITTFSFGIVGEYEVSPSFAVQSELLYARKGFSLGLQTDVDLFGVPLPIGARAETLIDYVEIPLLGKYKFGNDGISAYVAAGPTFGYATKGTLATSANLLVDIDIARTNIDLDAINFQRFEVGGAVSAGLTMHTPFGNAFVDARYNHGFTQLYDIPLVDEKLRNKGFALTAGFMVPLGN